MNLSSNYKIEFTDKAPLTAVNETHEALVKFLTAQPHVRRLKPLENPFDKIRDWARAKGILAEGDVKTQSLKLFEEGGEIAKAVFQEDNAELLDGIGDCVVVLTSLAHLAGSSIEECIEMAYDEIKNRKGEIVDGNFKKDA